MVRRWTRKEKFRRGDRWEGMSSPKANPQGERNSRDKEPVMVSLTDRGIHGRSVCTFTDAREKKTVRTRSAWRNEAPGESRRLPKKGEGGSGGNAKKVARATPSHSRQKRGEKKGIA